MSARLIDASLASATWFVDSVASELPLVASAELLAPYETAQGVRWSTDDRATTPDPLASTMLRRRRRVVHLRERDAAKRLIEPRDDLVTTLILGEGD